MGFQNYLTQYNSLKAFPMDLGKLLMTYEITTQKALLSKFTIKQKIIPIMVQRADGNLSIPTLYYTIDSVLQMIQDPGGTYIPDFGDGTELMDLFKIAMGHFSPGTAPEVMRELMAHIDKCLAIIQHGPTPVKLREWKLDIFEVLRQIKDYLMTNQEVSIGYAITARQGESPITVGNAVISSLSPDTMDIEPDTDMRSIIFADPFNGLNVNAEVMNLIEQIAVSTGKAISSVQNGSGVVEGAKVLANDISESVMDYLVEVRCAASNVRSLVNLCEETLCDMECDLFEGTTAEDCIADIPSTKLGWGDFSIISGDKEAIKTNTDDIFSMNQITGKNIQYVLGSIVTSDDETTRKALTEKLKNSIVETMKWESMHENYSDIPVAHYVDTSIAMLETLTRNTKYASRLEEAFKSITEGVKAAMEDGECIQGVFNPCAYTLNSATPFPVGVRASQLAFNNIMKAETDEDMDKAMIEFAKVYNVEENVFRRTPVEEGRFFKEKQDVTPEMMKKSAANVLKVLTKYADKYNKDTSEQEKIRKALNKMIQDYPDGKYNGFDKNTSVPTIKISPAKASKQDENTAIFSVGKYSEDVMWCLNSTLRSMIKEVGKDNEVKKDPIIKSISWDDGEGENNQYILVRFHEKCVMESEELFETNSVAKGARNLSRKVQKGSEKAIRNVGGTAHEIKQAAHNAVDPMEKYIGQMMQKLKKEDANKRREIIVKGGVLPKVLRWVKRSIPIIAGAAIGIHGVPVAAVAAGIALIGMIASDKYLDSKEKRKLLREIEDELEIVNEKIDDARGDSNKQKRYELIRIRNNLKRTKDRITYNLTE